MFVNQQPSGIEKPPFENTSKNDVLLEFAILKWGHDKSYSRACENHKNVKTNSYGKLEIKNSRFLKMGHFQISVGSRHM